MSKPVRWHTAWGYNYAAEPRLGRNPYFRIVGNIYATAKRDHEDGFACGLHQLSGQCRHADGNTDTLQPFRTVASLEPWQLEEIGRACADFAPVAVHTGAWLPPLPLPPEPNGDVADPMHMPETGCVPVNFDLHHARVAAEWGVLWSLGCIVSGDNASSHPSNFAVSQQRARACGRELWGEAIPCTPTTLKPSAVAKRGVWWAYSMFYDKWMSKGTWMVPVGTLRAAVATLPQFDYRPTVAHAESLAARGVMLDVWEGESAEMERFVKSQVEALSPAAPA